MEQTGEYRIAASREDVWTALNDPEVLARCLEGCQSMERVGDDRFDAKVKAKVGPVRATFDAQLTLEDMQPPERYTISANVKGGAAGFARGSARVNLTDEGAETLLQYSVDASIGGKLAQVGSRLVDGAARKMADDFFARFRAEMSGEEADGTAAQASESGQTRAPANGPQAGAHTVDAAPHESQGRWMIWLAAFAALLLALLFAL